MMENLLGKRFGKLTVIADVEHAMRGKHKRMRQNCQCDCGNEIVVFRVNLQKGDLKSCGCLKKGKHPIHGMVGTRLYRIWGNMVSRCYNSNHNSYKYYGGRGIGLCREWRENPSLFMHWALLHGYSDDLSIDRIDVNGDYSPENCRWADIVTQNRNTRYIPKIHAFGEVKCLAEWEEDVRCIVGKNTVASRLKRGWSVEEALTTPPNGRR